MASSMAMILVHRFEGTHVPIALLQKFIHTKGIVRVFDSGDIVIYQVRDVGPVR
jgi:hypothetical protein